MNRSRRQHKQSIQNKYKAAVNCKYKKRYKNIDEAWDKAVIRFIQKEVVTLPYTCVHGHIHLTGKANIGDLTHIPAHHRELFSTYTQTYKESFWKKMRRFLGLSPATHNRQKQS